MRFGGFEILTQGAEHWRFCIWLRDLKAVGATPTCTSNDGDDDDDDGYLSVYGSSWPRLLLLSFSALSNLPIQLLHIPPPQNIPY